LIRFVIFLAVMKIGAHILLLSMLMLVAHPMIVASQAAEQQAETCCCTSCCHGHTEDGPDQKKDREKDHENDHPCNDSCDCGCQFHLNALQFLIHNIQLAEEQDYFFGSYHNEYQFEYLNRHIHPPRLA